MDHGRANLPGVTRTEDWGLRFNAKTRRRKGAKVEDEEIVQM